MGRTRALGLAIVVAAALVTGCSAAPPDSSTSSSAPPSAAPRGGELLGARGIKHGPRGFSLPDDLIALRTIDQPNVVTLVLNPGDGPRVQGYLLEHAPAMGLTHVVSAEGSMTFLVDGWDGALTTSPDLAGLTLRRRP